MAGDQLVEDAARLGVDQEHAAQALAAFQGVEDGAVIGLPALGGVDHELLEGRTAAADHRLHLPAVTVPVGDGHVEGVVDAGLGFGPLHPGVVGVVERLLAEGDGEVDDGGDPAAGRRPGAGPPVVAGNRTAEGQLKVDVNVQPAGDDVLAGGVDDAGPAGVGRQVGSHGGDPLAANGYVRAGGTIRTDDSAPSDDQIDGHVITQEERGTGEPMVNCTSETSSVPTTSAGSGVRMNDTLTIAWYYRRHAEARVG